MARALGSGVPLVWRVLLLLLLLVLLPLGILGFTSIRQYEQRVVSETEKRLGALTKDQAMAVFQRLRALDSDIGVLAGTVEGQANGGMAVEEIGEQWRDRFLGFEILNPDAIPETLTSLGSLGDEKRKRWQEGRSVLVSSSSEVPSLWLARPIPPDFKAVLWAELNSAAFWPIEGLSSADGLYWLLLDENGRSVVELSPELPENLVAGLDSLFDGASGGFEWRDAQGRLQQARFWTVPLGHPFGHSGLTVLHSEPDPLAGAVLAVRRTLFLVSLAGLLVVILIAIRRLRVELGPMTQLTESTRRLAEGDLTARVRVHGPSDLKRLGQGFNRMAEQIERQFHLLQTSRSIASEGLLATRGEAICEALLAEVSSFLPGCGLAVILVDRKRELRLLRTRPEAMSSGVWETYPYDPFVDRLGDDWQPPPAVLHGLGDFRESLWKGLRRGEEIVGGIGVFGRSLEDVRLGAEALEGPAAQLELALSRVRLTNDLERANWGTLTALARAVDTKSPWTHGHSERVAGISVAIAAELGYSESEQAVIRRGSLLHDMGKIGIPGAVLDSARKLEPEELRLLRTHVEKGARILEPVESLAAVLPIVWQHHERRDGSGYPHGLMASQIHPHATIVAVADVFEALTAARPYREAWSTERTLDYLVERSDTKFGYDAVVALTRAQSSMDDTWSRPVRWRKS